MKDQTPPSILCPPDFTVTNILDVPHCAKTLSEFILGGGAASDNCSGIHYRCMDSPLVAGPCGGVIERIHIVFDDCLNTNFCIQKITVLGGTQVSISAVPANTNFSICLGGTLTFCVTALGNGPFTYVWMRDGLNIAGASGPCFTVTNLNPIDVGRYSVQVVSACETVTKPLSLPGCGAPQPLMMGIQFVPAGVLLGFRGLPERDYEILRGAELDKPWILIGVATTGANGLGEFLDTSNSDGRCRMYKLVAPTTR